MALLKIARMGHPVLARPAAPVSDPTAPHIKALVEDMIETMADADGAGLAAPQVHVPLRLVIFTVPAARLAAENRDREGEEGASAAAETTRGVPLTVLINPLVEALDDETTLGWEGCLSVPGLAGLVPRYRAVRYRGLTLEGEEIERRAEGFHARVVQHECDHLDGILYPQRMRDLSKLVFTSEMKHLREAAGTEEAEL